MYLYVCATEVFYYFFNVQSMAPLSHLTNNPIVYGSTNFKAGSAFLTASTVSLM